MGSTNIPLMKECATACLQAVARIVNELDEKPDLAKQGY